MTKKNVFVSLLLDRTGSMQSVVDDTIGGYNTYIDSLKESGDSVRFTMTLFDSQGIDVMHRAVDVSIVPHLTRKTYRPRAMTPLYDAIIKTIEETEKETSKDDSVLFAILTDGLENASKRYSREDVKEKINEMSSMGWSFVYLGANQDAWLVGDSIGITANITYAQTQTRDTITRLGRASRSYVHDASTGNAQSNFIYYWQQSEEES